MDSFAKPETKISARKLIVVVSGAESVYHSNHAKSKKLKYSLKPQLFPFSVITGHSYICAPHLLKSKAVLLFNVFCRHC